MSTSRRRLLTFGLTAVLAVAVVIPLTRPVAVEGQAAEPVSIGVLYATEPGAPASTRASAARIGAQIVNEYLASGGDATRISLQFRDTGRDPARAAAAVQELYGQGIRVFIGPETSAEVHAIEALPIRNDIALVSYASTASSLAQR